MPQRVIIMGAAGKDFHVFNTLYRNNPAAYIVAFTATQIPGIEGRIYPPELAGRQYPKGIPIEDEADLTQLIRAHRVNHVVFAYSDVSYDYVDAKRRIVEEAGASFDTPPVDPTMIRSTKPVVAVCAVRTGCGKSQTSRRVVQILRDLGKRTVVVRHPMPYGVLAAQRVQRFESLQDLALHDCTIEEREEYEPHIRSGAIVYAGVDYEEILRAAEEEADVVLWDGGNNDTPFFAPNVWITLVDPHRPGHEVRYHPGLDNLKRADVVLFNKMGGARPEDVALVEENVRAHNTDAVVVYANSPLTVADPDIIRGRRVLVVEDGPTLTHGGMKYGAGVVAAREHGAAELVDPRPYLVGSLKETFAKYPEIGTLLPAMGYGDAQVRDLEATIDQCDCDAVVIGTPIDLARIVRIEKPHTRVTYELEEISEPGLDVILAKALESA